MKEKKNNRLGLVLLGLALSFLFLEAAVRFTLYSKEQRAVGAAQLWRSYQNTYLQQIYLQNGCSFMDSLAAHPYLGFAFHGYSPCGINPRNRIGIFQAREFPHERDPNYYSILVVGGSVAGQLISGNRRHIWLEDILNASFTSPNGKPFRLFSGALGSWGLPNQLTMLNLYSNVVDAVIAIDGHNEAMRRTVDAPDFTLYAYLARSSSSYLSPIALDFLRAYRRFFLTNALLSQLYLPYTFFRSASAVFNNYEQKHSSKNNPFFDAFLPPGDWSQEKRDGVNRKKYLAYIQTLAATAKALNLNYAHFVQPIKAMGKILTPEEASYADLVDPVRYKKVILSASAEASSKGLHSYMLTDVFLPYRETIYADHVHCRVEPRGRSLGYSILSEAMAAKIATAWKLKKKH